VDAVSWSNGRATRRRARSTGSPAIRTPWSGLDRMARTITRRQPTRAPAADDLDAELAGIAAMNIHELRGMWRQLRGQEPAAALSKDLIARTLAHWRQEECLYGLNPHLTRQLAAFAKTRSKPPRHVKIGSVVVREHQGKLHEVLVVPGGFCWQGQTFASLSTIARKITGTSWSGPRFFGLRGIAEPAIAVVPKQTASRAKVLSRTGSIQARSPSKARGGAP
jgi:Protein of unknown function (DUF2924)